jgi:2-oxoisovalerate dehydrogenase E2 component (dihydrolipoyl transacylase)
MSQYVFKLPDLGEGTVESEIGEWFIKVGDQVNEEDIVGTMMTDKAAVEVSSPVSGKVVQLAGEPGDIVPVGAALVVFETAGADAADTSINDESAAVSEPGSNAKPKKKLSGSRIKTSPAIRLRAKEAGIDLGEVPGTGPAGRITRADFDAWLEATVGAARGRDRSHEPSNRGRGPLLHGIAGPETREIKIIGLRRIIAERMAEASREIPHFTYVEEVDVTELEALRQHLNGSRSDTAARLTLLPFLGMSLIRAVSEFPQCNATFDKDRNIIVQHGPVHLGIATQTKDGLKVPVVHNAQELELDELNREIRRVTAAARDNSIRKNELSGSTITITSLGRLGGIVSTPVINMPEVGIIGVNRAVERPVIVDGQIAVRRMMNLSSSFDHRFVDGFDAAAMIQRIREMLEHPATIFLP